MFCLNDTENLLLICIQMRVVCCSLLWGLECAPARGTQSYRGTHGELLTAGLLWNHTLGKNEIYQLHIQQGCMEIRVLVT